MLNRCCAAIPQMDFDDRRSRLCCHKDLDYKSSLVLMSVPALRVLRALRAHSEHAHGDSHRKR